MKSAPYKLRALLGFFFGALVGTIHALSMIHPVTVGGVALASIVSGVCFAILALIVPKIFDWIVAVLKNVSW